MIYGRTFLLYDCDSFTKAWYYQNFGLTEFKAVEVDEKEAERMKMVHSFDVFQIKKYFYYSYPTVLQHRASYLIHCEI